MRVNKKLLTENIPGKFSTKPDCLVWEIYKGMFSDYLLFVYLDFYYIQTATSEPSCHVLPCMLEKWACMRSWEVIRNLVLYSTLQWASIIFIFKTTDLLSNRVSLMQVSLLSIHLCSILPQCLVHSVIPFKRNNIWFNESMAKPIDNSTKNGGETHFRQFIIGP